MSTKLEFPFTREKVLAFKAGDQVSLSGRIVTGRDRFHSFLFEGGKSPVELKDGAIYHCGPVVVRGSGAWVVKAAGPTTSMRMERHTPWIVEHCGVRVLIGKGGMGEATRRACQQFGCVYLQAVGGAACSLASRIKSVGSVHLLNEFGVTEAVWELIVDGFEAVVTIDSRGRSLHRRIEADSRRRLDALLG